MYDAHDDKTTGNTMTTKMNNTENVFLTILSSFADCSEKSQVINYPLP
jgi:hypothetical protein